jgi:hypothetical protein
MANRNRTIQGSNAAIEGSNALGDLSATSDLHRPANLEQSPARQSSIKEDLPPSDLASATISDAKVMRAQYQPLSRREITPRAAASPSNSQRTQSSRKTNTSRAASKGGARGIFTNPTYRYEGSFISKLLSFVANILKVLERLILRLFTGPDRVTPHPHQQRSNTTDPAAQNQAALEQEEERRRRKRLNLA